MIRKRKLASHDLNPNLPPFWALSTEEVKSIVDAGEIEFNGSDSAERFELALDWCRWFYSTFRRTKDYWLTDKQISERLEEARDLAARLLTVLDGPLLNCTPTIECEASGEEGREGVRALGQGIREPLYAVVRWAERCIKEVEERRDKNPDPFHLKIKRPGFEELHLYLVDAWRVATATTETDVGTRSPLIPFLQEAVFRITRVSVGPDTAEEWAREDMRIVARNPTLVGKFLGAGPDDRT